MASVSGSRHGEALRISSEITRTLRRMYWPEMLMIAPTDIIPLLNQADVRFILIGNYGITGWRGEVRATHDVDILVSKRDHRKAVRVIQEAFPQLQVADYTVIAEVLDEVLPRLHAEDLAVTRFYDPATSKPLIDLWKPIHPLFKVAFRQTILVEGGYLIPNLEFSSACKFSAMTYGNRRYERKYLDAADFISMVQSNWPAIHRARLKRLGERVRQGGGERIIQMAERAKAGLRIEF